MRRIPHASVVAGALILGWVIFMIYHGDLPGFLWVLGIGGKQPSYCTEGVQTASGIPSSATIGGVSVSTTVPVGSDTGPV